jgi:DNA modification methylase
MQNELFEVKKIYERYLPIISEAKNNGKNINEWDIPYTIGELSYLTHNHYRYYGKFPSTVAGQLLSQYSPPSKEHYVLDNFCGSGTTLVEAKLRDIKSYGIDISWISSIVSEVKTKHINIKKVNVLLESLEVFKQNSAIEDSQLDLGFLNKWFDKEATQELFKIQQWLLSLPKSKERNFLLVGFLAIIRRVSLAHDAEVRPHVNLKKKQRNVSEAFFKKIKDMLVRQNDFQILTSPKTIAECFVADNQKLPKKFEDGKCHLLISHPPYLNSFNYRPVFSLEFIWGSAFEAEFVKDSGIGLIKSELVAHPANEKNTENYFRHLINCYQSSFDIQDKNGKLAVVIGDCTRNGKLIPVIDNTIEIVKAIGYKLTEINYRTTHYGLGKYAYKERADYHGKTEKRDAIIVFTR